jgi:predicted nucleic acid-binding protein
MTLVVDASMVVSGLVDSSPVGAWAASLLASEYLVAPHLMHAEAASVLRRAVLTAGVTEDAAMLAYAELASLRVNYFAFRPFAPRIWELRANLTPYDAWYVALAETLGAELATLDLRLSRAAGPRCGFVLPPETSMNGPA